MIYRNEFSRGQFDETNLLASQLNRKIINIDVTLQGFFVAKIIMLYVKINIAKLLQLHEIF